MYLTTEVIFKLPQNSQTYKEAEKVRARKTPTKSPVEYTYTPFQFTPTIALPRHFSTRKVPQKFPIF
jgi:hypothetical protein